MKIKLLVELDYDDEVMHGDDPEAIAWFNNEIISPTSNNLSLFCNGIGDEVGKIRVIEKLEK